MRNKIGIIGGGQLGRMLSLAAKPLGYEVIILDPTENCPAAQVADKHIVASFKYKKPVLQLAEEVDYLTYEIESANTDALEEIYNSHTSTGNVMIYPFPKSLEMIRDKFLQKELLKKYHIPVSDCKAINTRKDILDFAHSYSYPFMLKARLNAYDGRGNALITCAGDIDTALINLGASKSSGSSLDKVFDFDFSNLYLEAHVNFVKELAIVAARDQNTNYLSYPIVETIQLNNICHFVTAPALVSKSVEDEMNIIAKKIGEILDYVGVFAVEFFLGDSGEVLVNEIAPRVHNSGHFTIDACKTSQFEQHIRAITAIPLGKTDLISPAAMANLLADSHAPLNIYGRDRLLAMDNTYLHIYGKDSCKPERKMGHITCLDSNLQQAFENVKRAKDIIKLNSHEDH